MTVITLTENDPRVVTPEDPLIINETSVIFPNVVIEGGTIIANVETKATFKRLEKRS